MAPFAAGWNRPGFLPDNLEDVGRFDLFEEARGYLRDELDYASSTGELDKEGHGQAVTDLDALAGAGTVYVGEWAYWIQEVP